MMDREEAPEGRCRYWRACVMSYDKTCLHFDGGKEK